MVGIFFGGGGGGDVTCTSIYTININSPVHGFPGVRTEAFLCQKSGDVQLAITEWLSCCFVRPEKAPRRR